MFIKNDNLHRLEKAADRKEHFGIRKLTIGTASVLIGVSLYFGPNLKMVKADIQQPDKVSLQGKVGNDNSAEMLAQEQKDKTGQAGKKLALEDIEDGKTKKQSFKINDQSNASKSDTTNISKPSKLKTDKDDSNTLSLSGLKKGSIGPKKEEVLLAGSEVEDHGNTVSSSDHSVSLTVNHNNYHDTTGESEVITFAVGGVAGKQTIEPGDVVTFSIPVGNYNLGNIQSLPNGVGTTTHSESADQKWLYVTDTFNEAPTESQSQIMSQSISLDPYDLERPDDASGRSDENTFFNPDKEVTVKIADKHGHVKEHLSIDFHQIIKPSIDIGMERNKPRVLDSEHKQPLAVNHDYIWDVYVNQDTDMHAGTDRDTDLDYTTPTFSSAITDDGTTITVDVPASFVLNQAATQNLLNQTALWGVANGRLCPVTVSQAGKGQQVIFRISKSTDPNHFSVGNYIEKPYYMVGQFQMAQPNHDTTVQFRAHADQKLLHGLGELKDDAEDNEILTETILGKDDPQQGPSAEQIEIHLHGYRTDNKLPLDHVHKIALNHGEFENDNSQDLTNATIILKVPDGLDATSFLIPKIGNNRNYTYVITFDDGTTKEGPIDADTESDTFVKPISQIEIDHVNIPAGDGTGSVTNNNEQINSGGITIYGTVAQKYKNGTKVKSGDAFTTKIYLKTNSLSKESDDTQTIDAVPTYMTAGVDYTQNNYGPGHNRVGNISASFTPDDGAIVYFLLPENATYQLPADHDGITVLHVGDREVIKFTKAGSSGYANIELGNTAPAITSMKPIYVWLVPSKDNAVVGVENGYTGFDEDPKVDNDHLAFVEGNHNARFIAGSFGESWPQYYWKVMPVLTALNNEAAQGNQDEETKLHGTSKIHDAQGNALSPDMSFYTEIVNTSHDRMTDVVSVTNLPQTDTVSGLSQEQFKFDLIEDGVTVVGFENGNLISISPEIRYSYNVADLHSSINFDNYLTADQVTDWSKVKAVAIRIAQIDANESIQVQMKGKDASFSQDAGKIAYLSSRTQGGISKEFIIEPGPGSALSASIEILDEGTPGQKTKPTEPPKSQPNTTPQPPKPGTTPEPPKSQPSTPSTTPIKPTQPKKPTTPTQPKTPRRPGRKPTTSSNNKSHREQFKTKHYNNSFMPHHEKFDQSRTKSTSNNLYKQNVIKRTDKTTDKIVSNNSAKQSTTLPHTGSKKDTSLFVICLSLLGLGLSAWFETKRKHG